MCRKYLLALYKVFLDRTYLKIALVERWISFEGESAPVSDDERRNESQIYTALFSDECRAYVEELYRAAMLELGAQPYAHSEDALEALAFIQEIVASALWKHQCTVGETLESFAREFDRLDVRAERERLHGRAKST